MKSAPDSHPCPRCSRPVEYVGKGRPPVWCSDTCRVDAYRDRRAARRGVIALEVREVERIREVPVPTSPRLVEPSWDDVVARVLSSPKATGRVLAGVADMCRTGALYDAKNRPVRDGIADLTQALYEP